MQVKETKINKLQYCQVRKITKFTQDSNGLKKFSTGDWFAVSSKVYYQLQLKILDTVSLLYFDTIHKNLNLQFQELVQVNIICAVLLEFIRKLLHLIQVLLQSVCLRCIECAIHHKRDMREELRIYMWCKQAIIVWLLHMISIVSCCQSVKIWWRIVHFGGVLTIKVDLKKVQFTSIALIHHLA